MDNIKNDSYYIQKIQQDLEFIVKHMKNVDIEGLKDLDISAIPVLSYQGKGNERAQ